MLCYFVHTLFLVYICIKKIGKVSVPKFINTNLEIKMRLTREAREILLANHRKIANELGKAEKSVYEWLDIRPHLFFRGVNAKITKKYTGLTLKTATEQQPLTSCHTTA